MSDRSCLIEIGQHLQPDSLSLVMDGESGTWRLFVGRENIDFSLEGLREFTKQIQRVITDIEADPETYNAELRATWNV